MVTYSIGVVKFLQKGAQVNRLRQVRNERGFSQLTLAKLTNISPWDISRIENNWIRPYAGWRKRLARALGVTEKELFPEEQ